jgi:hypothetical protein
MRTLSTMNFRSHVGSTWSFVAVAFLTLFVVTGAAAQMPPGMTAVSGLYTNEDAGVQITFPDGWEGFAIETPKALIVATTMGEAGTKSIALIISEKTEVQDPTNPGEFQQEDNPMDCGTPTVTSRTVAGKSGQQSIVECTDDDGTKTKVKMVIANTDEEWIAVMYSAPTAEFAADEASFDAAVDSLQVEGAMDTGGSTGGTGGGGVSIDLTTVTRTVVIAGESVSVDFRTNSTISALAVDEANKQVSFTVDGETGTSGTTEVEIGQMLMGPYTVTIDGQATTDFEVENEGSVDAVMTLSYTHSEHDVVVTGTSVVPEFPVVLLGALAAIVGVVAVLGRTQFLNKQF